MAHFDLLDDSSSSWEINPESAYYVNKHTKNFESNQTLVESIITTNPIPSSFEVKLHIDAD